MRGALVFSSLGCPSYNVDQIIGIASGCGYAGVSLRTVRGQNDLGSLEEFSPSRIGETRGRFEAAGIEVACVASGASFSSPDPGERRRQIETAGRYAEIARGLGSRYLRVFGGARAPGIGEEEGKDLIAEGLGAACDLAAERGIEVLLETHDSLSRGADAAEVVARADKPNLFILWDVLHSLRFGETLRETWGRIGPLVRHVHLKDASAYGPDGFDLVLLGRGRVPLREAVGLLFREGYEGSLEFEWEKGWHPEIPGPEIALPHAAGYLECLLGELSGRR
jgi:sugar phosphate isomerase/epimerase